MSSDRGQFLATVAANVPLCRDHFRLVLRLEKFPPTRAGQFIQIACRAIEDPKRAPAVHEPNWEPGSPPGLWDVDLCSPTAMLRRPFSLAGRRDTSRGVELEVIHRVVGVGTHWLARLRIGDEVGILGPLGNSFAMPAQNSPPLLVGGGVGIPPMLYLAHALRGRQGVAFVGATNRRLLPLSIAGNLPADVLEPARIVAEFDASGFPSVVCTDDGSLGFRGYVTQALEAYLDRSECGPRPTVYTCGPEPMMKRVAEIAQSRGLDCQIAVERAMACGMGTCQSCCIRVKKPDPAKAPLAGKDWCYRLACTDGPIFTAAQLLW